MNGFIPERQVGWIVSWQISYVNSIIQLFSIDDARIKTNIMGEQIIFEFICKPVKRNLKILQEIFSQKKKEVNNIIQNKEKHIKYLKDELK